MVDVWGNVESLNVGEVNLKKKNNPEFCPIGKGSVCNFKDERDLRVIMQTAIFLRTCRAYRR